MAKPKPQNQSKEAVRDQSHLTDLRKAIFESVSKMSPQEGFKSLVSSGIYTSSGNLAKRYGG